MKPSSVALPSQSQDVRDAGAGLDGLRAARRWRGRGTTKLMPRVMISGWTRNTPMPTPVTRPASIADDERHQDGRGTPPGLWTSVAVTKPVIDATAPTDRSMPPVSMVIVWQPARIASGTVVRTMMFAQPAG